MLIAIECNHAVTNGTSVDRPWGFIFPGKHGCDYHGH
jgi:hypothetical protein